MWRICNTTHDKVDTFRAGRVRQSDPEFLADCGLPDRPDAAATALAVRRAVAGVGLVDPLFVRASDRFPEELGVLPLWDSLDWMGFLLELERELEGPPPARLEDWPVRGSFAVTDLVRVAVEPDSSRDA